jgi:hypothetical protein
VRGSRPGGCRVAPLGSGVRASPQWRPGPGALDLRATRPPEDLASPPPADRKFGALQPRQTRLSCPGARRLDSAATSRRIRSRCLQERARDPPRASSVRSHRAGQNRRPEMTIGSRPWRTPPGAVDRQTAMIAPDVGPSARDFVVLRPPERAGQTHLPGARRAWPRRSGSQCVAQGCLRGRPGCHADDSRGQHSSRVDGTAHGIAVPRGGQTLGRTHV